MSDNWKTLGARYAAEGFAAHLLDLRNHGRSFHAQEFTYEAMATDILEYCDANNLSNVDLIGHSMGGKVAMQFAVTYPEMLNKLIVADIAPKYYAPHHDQIMAALNAVDFSRRPSRNDIDEIMKPFVPDMGTRQFLMKNVYHRSPGQLAFRFNLEVFNDHMDIIGKPLETGKVFSGPVMFIRGAKSHYVHKDDMQLIREHFPAAKLATVPNAGHWLHADNPDDFLNITLNFLK
jgi:pimeloyl-ACP methyl ester carboxylesterase